MSRRFGRNQRRRAREAVAEADRRTAYWIERARAAEAREGALQRRLRNAIEVDAQVRFEPMDRIFDCEAAVTFRDQVTRARAPVDGLRMSMERPETVASVGRMVAGILVEKMVLEVRGRG